MKKLLLIAVALCLAACDSRGAEEKAAPPKPVKVRPGILGSRGWYPGDAEKLARMVDEFLDAAPAWDGPAPVALISPHAGYSYSGPVMGRVYRTTKGRKYDRVFVLGVNHRAPLDVISVPDFTHYETPLGRVPVDTETAEKLRASGDLFGFVPEAHAEEHSIEIQLPFLQRALGEFRLVPMLVGIPPEKLRYAARSLAAVVGPNDLVVASSDNTHYGPNFGYVPFPNDADVAKRLEELDMGAVDRILEIDLDGFLAYREKTKITICGRRTIGLLLALLPKDTHATLLGYDTSGKKTGRYENSVSYVGIAFTAALDDEDQKLALKIARESMTRYVRTGERFDPVKAGWKIPDSLRQTAGCFVTLTIDGRLRGCIGDILPVRPLYRAIAARAISSAAEDSRFRPVKADELEKIEIEISALSAPRRIRDWRSIRIGRHGIILSWDGHRRSVYLPQVAPEQGWDLETTLSHLSRKGGLPADAWRDPRMTFEVFTAQVFSE
jgi:AmmeMemoRadiSam system protein B/AmmeMemoRadiSam system protein A